MGCPMYFRTYYCHLQSEGYPEDICNFLMTRMSVLGMFYVAVRWIEVRNNCRCGRNSGPEPQNWKAWNEEEMYSD
jgi:hypothetical protein